MRKWTFVTLLVLLCFSTTPAFACSHPTDTPAKRKVAAIIRKAAKERGFGKADQRALVTLAGRESDFDPKERTGSYVGVLQVPCEGWIARIDWRKSKKHPHGSKHGTNKPRWMNPRSNTLIALQYIKKRYKTPRRALRHSLRYGWY